jgi:hypothetical protein
MESHRVSASGQKFRFVLLASTFEPEQWAVHLDSNILNLLMMHVLASRQKTTGAQCVCEAASIPSGYCFPCHTGVNGVTRRGSFPQPTTSTHATTAPAGLIDFLYVVWIPFVYAIITTAKVRER